MFAYFWLLKIILINIIKKGLTNSIGWNRGKKLRSIHLLEPFTSTPIKGTKIKKINDIKKYYLTISNDENYEKSLSILAETRKEIFEFFDNVKVNEENETLRKNRLELINMLCKTFQNFMNFQLLKASNE